jgi:hypothetical protein
MSKLNEYCKKKNLRDMDIEYLLLYRVCLVLLPFMIGGTLLFVFFGDKILAAGGECLFRKISGFYCIGCGGTRAFNYLVHLHILKSIFYHPFVPYTYFAYFFYTINSFLYRHNKKCISKLSPFLLIYIGVGILTINFLWKNIMIFFGIHLI